MYWLEFAGEDDPFAALEATAAASDVAVLGPGIGTASALSTDRVRGLALTSAAGPAIGHTDASVASARSLLDAAPLDRDGTVAVRARDVRGSAGIDTQRAERELGAVLTDRGFAVDLDDPDHTLRALFARGSLARDPAAARDTGAETGANAEAPLGIEASGLIEIAGSDDGSSSQPGADDADLCLLGWVETGGAEHVGSRAPTDRPFFQPGSMDPRLARPLANLAGARPGTTIVDPMCGTGGLLLEATLLGARAVGVDAQSKMAAGTWENLSALAPTAADWTVARGDATRLPLADDAADGLLVDVPYERQSAVAGSSLDDLVRGALADAVRVAPRAIVVADRDWSAAARDAGWTVRCVHRRRVHRSLVRSIHVLEREA